MTSGRFCMPASTGLKSFGSMRSTRHDRTMTRAVTIAVGLALLGPLSCRGSSCASSTAERPAMTEPTPIRLPGAEPFTTKLSAELKEALARQGADYAPRTHHLLPTGQPKYINRLIRETSPYLLQHAHNPVNWRPWGPDAFEAATALGRPILLSVGYSTCHWCHVMERESFENEQIAEFINSHYIAIKVDREERPDVDSVYMTAVQLMTGRGGWPMTVIMTPEGRPYFGGTYFPPHDGDRGMRIGFLSILQRLHQAFVEEKDKVVASAAQVSKMIAQYTQRTPPEGMPGPRRAPRSGPAPDQALRPGARRIRARAQVSSPFDLRTLASIPPTFRRSVGPGDRHALADQDDARRNL